MTNTTCRAPEPMPLWDYARIDKAAMDDWNYSTSYEAARSALRKMRSDYETLFELIRGREALVEMDNRRLVAQFGRRAGSVTELEREIAKERKPIGCPATTLDDGSVLYRGFTITTEPFRSHDNKPRYTWSITWQEFGITSIPVTGTSGYRSPKLAIGFAKDYINERLSASERENGGDE